MIIVSSNHYSHDQQVADAVAYLRHYDGDDDCWTQRTLDKFDREFPEYNSLKWSGSWVDTEASEVDIEYMQWVTDWLEANTSIYWNDGEPVINETEEDEYPGPLGDELPCGCRPHITRMGAVWGFYCETEEQGYCNFECPHEEE